MDRRLLLALCLTACATTKAPPEPTPVEGSGPTPREGVIPSQPLDAPTFDPASVAETDRIHRAAEGVEDGQLAQLLREHWDYGMRTSPVWATWLGDRRFDDQLPADTPERQAKNRAAQRGFLARANAIDASTLNAADALNRGLFIRERQDDIAREVCKYEQWSVSPRSNGVVGPNRLVDAMPIDSAEAGQNLLARYRKVPAAVDAEMANLRLGLASGRVATAESLRRTVEQIRTQLEKPVAEQPMRRIQADEGVDATELLAQIDALLETELLPKFREYLAFLETELLPAGRSDEQSGLVHLPDGEACYAALVANYTTLPYTPQELHDLGLAEMAKIHGEFVEIGGRAFGADSLQAVYERLRTDEALYFDTSEAVQAKAEEALGRATEAMVDFFGRLPQAPCTVVPIPDYEAPYTTIAYYRGPNPDGSKPGEYYVNTYAPETRPRHEAEVLAFHEAIPGHHLQIAIAQELPALPAFRRHGGFTAFVEGWGLYSERLSQEMGLYSGDTDLLGMLSFDAWRAGRLVVDTGIHALGWSRQQAIDYLAANTPLAPNNIDNEVDRYVSWPGQALAYKVGQLEIRKLRAEAEAAKGEQFDVKAFHDVVLGGGALPLPTLRSRVEAWLGE
jgi:uncharacterized protein (DUF885 family)